MHTIYHGAISACMSMPISVCVFFVCVSVCVILPLCTSVAVEMWLCVSYVCVYASTYVADMQPCVHPWQFVLE